jgi:Domain of unknown function (DUF4157)
MAGFAPLLKKRVPAWPQQTSAFSSTLGRFGSRLALSERGDPAEQEADHTAQEVLAGPLASGAAASLASRPAPFVASAPLHPGPGSLSFSTLPPAVEYAIGSPGDSLEPAARAFMESRFGHDFSNVSVHTGEAAQQAAQSVGARAFTLDRHIVFANGQYPPRSPGGQRLLAHELVHVVQQRQGAGGPVLQRDEAGGAKAAGHPVAEGAGNVAVSVGATMTAEAGLRALYDQGAREITKEALKVAAEGGNTPEALEKAARWAVQARNDLKAGLRAKGSVVTKALAEARNIKKYGDKIGPTYDQLIREGKTPPDIIGSAGKANAKISRAATRMKVAGRLLIAIDLAIVTWEVISAPEGSRLRTAVGGLGGIGGALAGGKLGSLGGAKLGAAIGTFIEPGGGTAIGGAIGGILGGVGGAVAGGYYGKKAAESAFDIAEEIFAPNLDADMSKIDASQDAIIRTATK